MRRRDLGEFHAVDLRPPYRQTGAVKSWWATANASCLPTTHPYRGYNDLTSPIVRAAGIPILPVWEPSLPHHRAHVGWKSLRGGRNLDCTHFCLASGLLDHWVELLVARMLPSLNVLEVGYAFN